MNLDKLQCKSQDKILHFRNFCDRADVSEALDATFVIEHMYLKISNAFNLRGLDFFYIRFLLLSVLSGQRYYLYSQMR